MSECFLTNSDCVSTAHCIPACLWAASASFDGERVTPWSPHLYCFSEYSTVCSVWVLANSLAGLHHIARRSGSVPHNHRCCKLLTEQPSTTPPGPHQTAIMKRQPPQPPSLKELTSQPWWQTVSTARWIGTACGILGAGEPGHVSHQPESSRLCPVLLCTVYASEQAADKRFNANPRQCMSPLQASCWRCAGVTAGNCGPSVWHAFGLIKITSSM